MALKKNENHDGAVADSSTIKAHQLFSSETSKKTEKKVLTTFSIAPSEKNALENLFSELGMSWSGGIRVALKEFYRNHIEQV